MDGKVCRGAILVHVYAPGSGAVSMGWGFLFVVWYSAMGCFWFWRGLCPVEVCVMIWGYAGSACGVAGFPISHRPRSHRWVQGNAYTVHRPVFSAMYVYVRILMLLVQ